MRRQIAAGLGVLLAVLGLAALAVPGLTAPLPVGDVAVSLLGGILLVGAVRELQRRRTTELDFAATDDHETTIELPTPGDAFDRRLRRIAWVRGDRLERERVRDSVRDAAIDAIRRRRGCSRAEAERLIETGSWTDDPFAAAFLARERPDVSPTALLRERLRTKPTFRHRAGRAVAAVDRLLEGPDD